MSVRKLKSFLMYESTHEINIIFCAKENNEKGRAYLMRYDVQYRVQETEKEIDLKKTFLSLCSYIMANS
jgi:hypothetical protein